MTNISYDASDDRGPVINATFDSECPYCGEDIEEGERIMKVEDYADEWLHEECALEILR